MPTASPTRAPHTEKGVLIESLAVVPLKAVTSSSFLLVGPRGIGSSRSTIHQTHKEIPLAKPPVKKAPAKKPAAPAIKPVKEALTKSALVNLIAEENGVTRDVAKGVLASIENAMAGSIHPRGVGEFTFPG